MSNAHAFTPPKVSPPPAKPLPLPPVGKPAAHGGKSRFSLGGITERQCQRTILYGTGGVGKTTLACLAARHAGTVGFIDLDQSLACLRRPLEEAGVASQVKHVGGVETWDDLRECLAADIWQGVGMVVLDTLSRAEELAMAWTLANTPHEKGHRVTRLEDYGFGKGYSHVYETFLALFADFDRHIQQGRSVTLVCHEITSTVLNPQGEDYPRWEPRLQHPSSQKSSVRLKAKEWADHLLYLGYDVVVDKNGVAQGSGTRTIQTVERPWCMAKSRTLRQPIIFAEGDSSLWSQLFPSV